jgi:hypothetical protein
MGAELNEDMQPVSERNAMRDGLAAVAVTLLTVALIVFLVSRII